MNHSSYKLLNSPTRAWSVIEKVMIIFLLPSSSINYSIVPVMKMIQRMNNLIMITVITVDNVHDKMTSCLLSLQDACILQIFFMLIIDYGIHSKSHVWNITICQSPGCLLIEEKGRLELFTCDHLHLYTRILGLFSGSALLGKSRFIRESFISWWNTVRITWISWFIVLEEVLRTKLLLAVHESLIRKLYSIF